VTSQQSTALEHHCRLAVETIHPRFRHIDVAQHLSVIVTVNSGYE
jgi:hypothetical protein